jgi:hypothetical protein
VQGEIKVGAVVLDQQDVDRQYQSTPSSSCRSVASPRYSQFDRLS